jgi:hypothetical protein
MDPSFMRKHSGKWEDMNVCLKPMTFELPSWMLVYIATPVPILFSSEGCVGTATPFVHALDKVLLFLP